MRIIYLLLVVIVFLVSCRCNYSHQNRKKKSIILVSDNIDSNFMNKIKTFKESVVEQFPYDYESVNIDIYLASAQYQGKNHFSASFTNRMLKEEKKPEYNRLSGNLKNAIKPAIPNVDKAIVNCLSGAFQNINEPDVNYLIVLNSDLLENSGTNSTLIHDNPGWVNGNFRFVDNNNVCQPLELAAAEKQLDNPQSPVMRKLTLAGKFDIQLYIISNEREVNSTNSGCDRKRITTFWNRLFEKIGIQSVHNNSNMKNVPFF